MALNDKIHDPLFAELFRIALPQMEGYQSDLGHDTLRLAVAVPGERYLWGVRKHGTEMRLLDEDPHKRSSEISIAGKRHPEHRWHLLTISAVRQDGYCSGTVTALPSTMDEIGRVQDRIDMLPEYREAAPRDPMHHEPMLKDALAIVQREQQASRLQQLIDEDPFKEPL